MIFIRFCIRIWFLCDDLKRWKNDFIGCNAALFHLYHFLHVFFDFFCCFVDYYCYSCCLYNENMWFIYYRFVMLFCCIIKQWDNHLLHTLYTQLYKTICVLSVFDKNLKWMTFALAREVRKNIAVKTFKNFAFNKQRSTMQSKWFNQNLS